MMGKDAAKEKEPSKNNNAINNAFQEKASSVQNASPAESNRSKNQNPFAGNNPYSDIIRHPHHEAANRPHMSLYDRAAQFSPYAALVGFDGVIAETGRLTDRKIELSESEKAFLDQKLTLIDDKVQTNPEITVVYFVPDSLKDGGKYQEYTGKVRQIDAVERTIVFLAANGRSAGKAIPIDDISEIHGELVNYMDEDF